MTLVFGLVLLLLMLLLSMKAKEHINTSITHIHNLPSIRFRKPTTTQRNDGPHGFESFDGIHPYDSLDGPREGVSVLVVSRQCSLQLYRERVFFGGC